MFSLLFTFCLGVSSSTLVSLQFPPTNISLSRQTVELVELDVCEGSLLSLTTDIYLTSSPTLPAGHDF